MALSFVNKKLSFIDKILTLFDMKRLMFVLRQPLSCMVVANRKHPKKPYIIAQQVHRVILIIFDIEESIEIRNLLARRSAMRET